MQQFPLSAEIEQFIAQNLHQDLASLALELAKKPKFPKDFILNQIYGRKKAKEKLPNWQARKGILYPARISVEQCSSERTAQFKASLVSGALLIDLTGGFGVDDAFFAQKIGEVRHVERNRELSEIFRHNMAVLGIQNATAHTAEGIAYLQAFRSKADWVYLDPARRDAQQKKVVGFEDCEPNVLANLDLLLEKAENILVKASPMLDLRLAITQLQKVVEIWVVSVENEAKELLFRLGKEAPESPTIHCINLLKDGEVSQFSSDFSAELASAVALSEVKKYIYEPNASIMKAGLFKSLATQLGLSKLHAHSHLFTNDSLLPNFPGRSFEVMDVLKFSKKELLKHLPKKKANIAVRNFPLSVAEIRKKTGIKEGGEHYIFATTNWEGKKICLLCRKA